MISSGALNRVANPPAVLAISRIVNNTGQQIDTDLLVKKIRVVVLQSGQAVTTTTVGLGGRAEDPLAKGMQQENEFMNDQKITRLPDFTLSGKIIETRARAGNVRQSTYSFQLSLTDTKTGNAVWESEKEITKQGKRPQLVSDKANLISSPVWNDSRPFFVLCVVSTLFIRTNLLNTAPAPTVLINVGSLERMKKDVCFDFCGSGFSGRIDGLSKS
ncbi:MAG: hypothetical protein WDM76_18005 [Limisphaerales bacterium]